MFTKVFWKKVWTWLKHYWYWPVIIVLLIFSIGAGASSRKKIFGLLDKQKENYEKEIQIIKETTEEADKKKTEIFEEHLEEIEKIEEHHDVKVRELETEKQKELVDTIKKNKDKPEALAKKVAKILSAAYHEENR